MLLDMHIHEQRNSKDSHISLEEIVLLAKNKGLQAVCITDHDSMGLKEYAKHYEKEVSFPIFVGIEYYSLWGDIIAFGIDDYPKERVSAQSFLDHVRLSDGFSIACHPFRRNNRGLSRHLNDVRNLDCVEVLNGSTENDRNLIAMEYAHALGLKTSGASDSHIRKQIGVYASMIEGNPRNMEEFLRALKENPIKPMAYINGHYEEVTETMLRYSSEKKLYG